MIKFIHSNPHFEYMESSCIITINSILLIAVVYTLDYTIKSVTPEHRAARETLKIDHFQLIFKDNEFLALLFQFLWYIQKKLFTLVSVKVVDP